MKNFLLCGGQRPQLLFNTRRARCMRKACKKRAQGVYGACMKRAGSMLGACKEWSCPPAGSGGGLRKIVTEKWRREGKDVEYSMY